jgi:hypothetical protein
MFMVTRRDTGELAYLISQPAAVAIESLVHWSFCRVRSRAAGPDNTGPALARYAGYVWVAF